METFKKIDFEDLEIIEPYFTYQNTRICDYSLGTRFMWRNFFNQEYIIINDTIIFKIYLDGDTWFEYPLGKDINGAIKFIEQYCLENNLKLIFGTIPYDYMLKLKERYPEGQIMFSRNWCDYLYDFESFAAHKGKKYNKKRNHIKNFERRYPNHRFERISIDNIEKVKLFYDRYYELGDLQDTPFGVEEAKQVYCALKHYDKLKLTGGALFVDDECIGFSFGEVVNDTMIHHIEKSDTSYTGSYQKLVYEFLQLFLDQGVQFVNREEDDGDFGLRKSKFSYKPEKLLNKYTVFTKKQDVNIHLVALNHRV